MPTSQFQSVDLLEVYHAKALQHELLRDMRRLRNEDQLLPESERLRRKEIAALYESMLVTCNRLLEQLGEIE